MSPADGVTAKIIADSEAHVPSLGKRYVFRLTTMEVRFHRFVLAELNTHRRFSRNSASSRAIPVRKQLQRVREDPAIPVVWASEQKGMQGGAQVEYPLRAQERWLRARDSAVEHAEALVDQGVHKSIVNRLLEPYMWHTAILSSTEWENFFAQRCSPLAQPEIRVLAEKMRDALTASKPQFVPFGEWHLPYLDPADFAACAEAGLDPRHISVARCARVSYLTHDGKRDVTEDEKLYQRLASADPPHASPLEHVATPSPIVRDTYGNFQGWEQLRHRVFQPDRTLTVVLD